MIMAKRNRKAKLTATECRQSVRKFFEKQARFKQVQSQFNELKAQFNSDMEDYFECEGIDKSMTFSFDGFVEGGLVVNRIQKSSVEFDPDKLEKALGKSLAKQVIIKCYEVTDMDALIAYLKECDVDPKIFKSFLAVSKSVDTQELDRLEEIGKVTTEQVQGCYTIKRQNPYFTVGVKRGHDDGEQKW